MDFVASTPGLRWERSAGLVPYDDAVRRMQAEIAAIQDGAPELVWLLEHPPLYTAGSSARDEDLLSPGRFPRHLTGRGGQWTYHGPGQRVAYVMLNLARAHGSVPARDLHLYVAALERWVIAALAAFDVRGERRAGRVGVWVANGADREAKIAAVGVRVTRWVSWHGVAVNVSPDLSHYDGIVPCGIRDHGVTSLRALGVNAELPELDAALRQAWGKIFGEP